MMDEVSQNAFGSNRLRAAGLVATIAALIGGIADILLFTTPGFATDLFSVRYLPDWRIQTGTLLAISVIPFLGLGYWAFSRYLTGVSSLFSDLVFVGGIYGAGLGNAIHGTVGTLVQVVQRNNVTLKDEAFIVTYARFAVPLYVLFYLLMALGTVALATVIWRRKTAFPRWFILLLPLWSNVLILPLGQVVPALGEVFYPSIANLSHALMFGTMTVLFWERASESGPSSDASNPSGPIG